VSRKRTRKRDQRALDAGRSSASPAARPSLSLRRKWLFRFLAVLVLPLFVLGGSELLLRLMGSGFDPHFFKKTRIGGKDYYVTNEKFGLRFFPPNLARIPSPAVVPATTTPGTFRIFIFGESAALGDPRPNYGAGCFLEVLLRERFPRAKFEVINTSMTAINSHVILPIARECAGHAGDLWIVYMGNNEMVGPFGAATVFGVRAPPVWLVRANVQLQRLRVVQVLLELSRRIRKNESTSSGWHGMEMFTHSQVQPNDPRRQIVHKSFEKNLYDIVQAGLASDAKIVLSTVAVNLKDCPPFGTASSDDSPATYEKAFQEGTRAAAQGDFTDAQSNFQKAIEILPDSAEARFQLATCLLRLTNTIAARSHFLQAVDADTLPFRADSKINETIRAVARQFTREPVKLCDAAEILSTNTPGGIPGEELFYEHVHLNPNGNYALALAWAGQVENFLEPTLKRDARPVWASQPECEQLLGLTDWNRVSILEEILQRIQRPPFSGQSVNAQQVANVQREISELRRGLTSEAAARAREVYSRALLAAPENFRLHENYAEFLEAMREWPAAIAERRKVCELIPNESYFPYFSLGMDLKDAGALSEAREMLLKAAALKPDQGEVRLELGIVLARQGEWEAARQQLEMARQFESDDPKVLLYLGEVLWKLDRHGDAIASLREAIRLSPSDWQPHYRLASDLAQERNFSEAATEYQEALRLNPSNIKTRLGLAGVLMNLGREPEALRLLDEALELEPTNQAVLEFKRNVRRARQP
jgi:tetratricopeptide (TPR) repeat protein